MKKIMFINIVCIELLRKMLRKYFCNIFCDRLSLDVNPLIDWQPDASRQWKYIPETFEPINNASETEHWPKGSTQSVSELGFLQW